ncbi:UNVERIFIED_CONTAM: hypothetical protein PYX00_002243 [Menopon gallinae]|uniref:C2 domain-containing protein n=1 Tax=Menopon gallinae TaxID=328185 RepID=A0AAW2IG01_9NEOP
MSLGLWGRLIVVGIGFSFVLVAVIIVVCFVHPCCYGFRCLERVANKKKYASGDVIRFENGKKLGDAKLGQCHWPTKNDYIIYETGKNGLQEKKVDETCNYQTKERDINLKYAPFSVNPSVAKAEKLSESTLKVKLSYKMLNGDNLSGRLAVHLLEANSLPYREYFTSLEPYIVLDVISNRWPFQKNEKIVQSVQSRVIRHTFNPKFDQTFLFDAKKCDIKDWCLKFTLFDQDRLTRQTPICERKIYLRDVKNLMMEPEVVLVTHLQEIKRNQGELLFGITYLPTAQRLSISIMKASCLKFLSVVQSVNEFNPYVRVLMLNSQGKCIKKKKTSFKVADENPVFNETLAFDLPVSNLEHVVFLLVLCSKILGKRSSSDGSITDAEAERPQKDIKDSVLGVIVIGRNVRCSKARDHWLMVMQNPRKIISVWHRFR